MTAPLTEAANALPEAQVEDKRLRALYEVEQILGKALGYPWYMADQANFPGATEADGVCTGEHVAASLAAEAATALAEAREKNEIMLVNFESVAKHQANRITEARAENERLRATMNEAIGWCQAERSKLSGDGYDYASGEEYGLRRAQIELERRAALAPKEPKP